MRTRTTRSGHHQRGREGGGRPSSRRQLATRRRRSSWMNLGGTPYVLISTTNNSLTLRVTPPSINPLDHLCAYCVRLATSHLRWLHVRSARSPSLIWACWACRTSAPSSPRPKRACSRWAAPRRVSLLTPRTIRRWWRQMHARILFVDWSMAQRLCAFSMRTLSATRVHHTTSRPSSK